MFGSETARIYYLHPLLAGVPPWSEHLERCAALGFDHVLLAPPFAVGRTRNLFLVADHDRPHPQLGFEGDADALIAAVAEACRLQGLRLLLDVQADRVAAEGVLAQSQPAWFENDPGIALDPRRSVAERGAARFREMGDTETAIAEWWSVRLRRWLDAGVVGFRCLGLAHTAPSFWRKAITDTRRYHPDTRFIAWTCGLLPEKQSALAGCGFDDSASSAAWWDYREGWFAAEYQRLARVAPPLAFPEAPFEARVAVQIADAASRARISRRALWFTAAVGGAWLLPMGYEFGASDPLDPANGKPGDFTRLMNAPRLELSADVRAANALIAEDRRRRAGLLALSAVGSQVASFLRADAVDPRHAQEAALILVNADADRGHGLPFEDFLPAAGGRLGTLRVRRSSAGSETAADGATLDLAAAEVQVLEAHVAAPALAPASTRSKRAIDAALRAPRIVIDELRPAIDGGRFALRRIAGETLSVEVRIFADGHGKLAAVLLWRPVDRRDWVEVPLVPLGNDRWSGEFTPTRIGRHEFTVLAWEDPFGSLQSAIAKKHAAGVDVSLELEEARLLLSAIASDAEDAEAGAVVSALADRLKEVEAAERLALVLAAGTAASVAAARYRPFALRREPAVAVEIERTAARYASWYELFPRSQTDDAKRHGSFDDVIARLPAIRNMGFDVLYFPPIHPIGKTHRKGRNNSLKAERNDPGSPYAIGSKEGGHEAIHHELGTLADFHRLVAAADAQGLEIALDFAIQCSPDHPWLKQHPGWFAWRPDGSIQYAENPPKKYEDIVNVDFHAADAMPGLWLALRDIVLFWVREGVKIFRVDNPHTKPLPFWEWLIADVRGRHPEVIFLAEAFTAPATMYRLGRIGFSQSYTYFTWRNTKQEMAEYLTQLNTAPVSEFYRPHFFVNTPDINPFFLQTGGRAGFLIRAALATMGSGLWGLYSGFELCDSAALPGKEEYLDSEKFQIKPRALESYLPGPGNIIGEITTLNRIRRENPALQTHLGFSLYHCWNDRILYFGKRTADRSNFILVAISLDPHEAQEAHFEVPLWELGLPDQASIEAEDLMNGHRWWWQGKTQFMRIEPWRLPFGIWRLRTRTHVRGRNPA